MAADCDKTSVLFGVIYIYDRTAVGNKHRLMGRKNTHICTHTRSLKDAEYSVIGGSDWSRWWDSRGY